MSTVKYSGTFKRVPRNYVRTFYNGKYWPQWSHVWQLHNKKSATLALTVESWQNIWKYAEQEFCITKLYWVEEKT